MNDPPTAKSNPLPPLFTIHFSFFTPPYTHMAGHNQQIGPQTFPLIRYAPRLQAGNLHLNTAATLDHHNHIGDFVHIAPGVHTGGDVQIGHGTLVGIGAIIMPQCHVGQNCRIGAGALIHRHLAANLTAVGLPAQPR